MSKVTRITIAAPGEEREVFVNTTDRMLALRTTLKIYPKIAESTHLITLSIIERPGIQVNRFWKMIDGEETEVIENYDPVIEPTSAE